MINNGFTHELKNFRIRIRGFILDAPAKAYILCVKNHNGYFSCTKCKMEGTAYGKTVYFPLRDIDYIIRYCEHRLRCDLEFKRFEYSGSYQKDVSILNQLPYVGLVSDVPIDKMHAVDLGVMRLLIRFWLGDKGRKRKNYKLQIQLLNSRLESCKYILPEDLNRRC